MAKNNDDSTNLDISKLSFEEGLKNLEGIVSSVETGNAALEDVILAYERGVKLLEHLRNKLNGAEEKLKILQQKQ